MSEPKTCKDCRILLGTCIVELCPRHASVDALEAERNALALIIKRYRRMEGHGERLCPDQTHYPIRNPFCDRCALTARIEEAAALALAGDQERTKR